MSWVLALGLHDDIWILGHHFEHFISFFVSRQVNVDRLDYNESIAMEEKKTPL